MSTSYPTELKTDDIRRDRAGSPAGRAGRAHRLLQRVLAESHLTAAAVAEELVVPRDDLRDYLAGAPIPLDRQLCLALLVLESAPALARDAHALREQAAAAIEVRQSATAMHRITSSRLGRT